LNGKAINTPENRGYLMIARTWKSRDVVDYELPMTLRLEPMPDNPSRAAVMYGPILLAGDLGPINGIPPHPVFVADNRPVGTWMKRTKNDSLVFSTRGVGRPGDVILRPFYSTHDRRYGIYWDMYTGNEWERREKEIFAEQARMNDIEARTVDVMRMGEMQPERDKGFQGEKTTTGDYRGRKWRQAIDGGWFSFILKTRPSVPMDLVVTYWGSEAGKREFDIRVNERTLAVQVLARPRPDQFVDIVYPLPREWTEGGSTVTISFFPHKGMIAGRVFGCRIVQR
jgi:hypothetical protein